MPTKPAGKAKKAAKSQGSKPARKAPQPKKASKSPSKGKGKPSARPVSKRAPRRPNPATLPGHRATKAENRRHMDAADHAHQDPRWQQEKPDERFAKARTDPRLDPGAIKTRGVPRMDNVTNWYRQAPKPKES